MISIITSLYKSDQYLDSFAANLKNFAHYLTGQKFVFEIIVIANSPTAREKRLAKDFAGQSWFSFHSVEREPLYATWNRGVNLARGEIIGFWNADDVRYPQALPEAEGLINGGSDLVYFPFKIGRYLKIFGKFFLVHKQLIDRQVPEYAGSSRQDFQRSMHCGPFFLFSRQLYDKVGPFDEQFKIVGDFDWCIRAAKGGGGLVKGKTIAGQFRVDGGGLSAGVNALREVENNIVYTRHDVREKIVAVDQNLAKTYRPGEILCQGAFHGLNSFKARLKNNL